MTHFAQWQITDISIVNEYFVCIDFHTALGNATIQFIGFVFLCISRCTSVITMTLLLMLLLVSRGKGGIDGLWNGFSETQVRRIHGPFDFVFMLISARGFAFFTPFGIQRGSLTVFLARALMRFQVTSVWDFYRNFNSFLTKRPKLR